MNEWKKERKKERKKQRNKEFFTSISLRTFAYSCTNSENSLLTPLETRTIGNNHKERSRHKTLEVID